MTLREYIFRWQEVYDKKQAGPPPTRPIHRLLQQCLDQAIRDG